MKRKYFFIIIVIPFLCLAQENDKNIKLADYLKSIENQHLENYSTVASLSTTDFNHLLKEAYEAIEIASSDLLKITQADVNYRNANSNLLRQVEARYSSILGTLIRIPIFVKAKILSSQEVSKGGFSQINLRLEPELIIKGKEIFLNQPDFEVFYRRYEMVLEEVDYKIGKSYLFPLWDRGEPENQIFAIATWISGNGSRFLVEDSVLHDENDFFKIGIEVSWDEFVKNINEMISCIINEKVLDKYILPNHYRSGRGIK
jgi:predicted DNA binding CopG/RHH family protein